jgi:hypothetical protein
LCASMVAVLLLDLLGASSEHAGVIREGKERAA